MTSHTHIQFDIFDPLPFVPIEIQSKPVYNDKPWDPKIVAAVNRWSLFGGRLCYKRSNWDLKIVVVVDRWLLFGGGR